MAKQKTVSLAELKASYNDDRRLGYFPTNALKRAIKKEVKKN